ncbi:hypothetical protein GEMRC1_002701 [Eukaryota sp. GEM-RC1]
MAEQATDYYQKYYWLKGKFRDLEKKLLAQESEITQLRTRNQELLAERTHFIDRLIELEHLDEEEPALSSETAEKTAAHIISSVLCDYRTHTTRCGRRVIPGLTKCLQHAPHDPESGFVFCEKSGCNNPAKQNLSGPSFCVYHMNTTLDLT